jgi:hypothetical protein
VDWHRRKAPRTDNVDGAASRGAGLEMEQKGQVNGAFIFLEQPAELKRLLRGSSRLVEDIEEAIHPVGDVDMKLGCRRLGAFSQGSKSSRHTGPGKFWRYPPNINGGASGT